MQKVYLVINRRGDYEREPETYTDIVHVCNDVDLAVEYANEFIKNFIHDALREDHKGRVWIEATERSVGKYYRKDELFEGRCYLGFEINDNIVESYDIKIEEHEVKED